MDEKDEEEQKFDIVMKDKAYDQLFCLMENIKAVNEGDEIGAWLTGEWTSEEDGTIKLLVDKFIIPKQEVSGAAVDMGPEGMIDTIQQLTKKDKPIIGHWHIHPFGMGDTSWSGGDETKIEDWMLPEKGRKIFIFMLSSLSKLKARVEIVTETKYPISDTIVTQLREYDALPVRRENTKENKTYLKGLIKTIKDKVTKKVYAPVQTTRRVRPYNPGYSNYTHENYSTGTQKKLTEQDTGPLFLVARSGTYVRVKIKGRLRDFLEVSDMEEIKELRTPSSKKEKATLTMYGFGCETIAEAAIMETTLSEKLNVMGVAYEIYEEELEFCTGGAFKNY